jgi:hypothetical protein
MNKKILVSVASLAMIAMPFLSFASVSIEYNGMTLNGQQVATVHAGSTFNLMARATANSGDEMEYARVTVLDTQGNLVQPDQCLAITPRLVDVTNGQLNVNGVKTESDLPDGGYQVKLETFGISGVQQSNGCDDNHFVTSQQWSGRLFIDHTSSVSNADTVIGNNSNTSSSGSSLFGGLDLTSLKSLLAMLGFTLPGTTPVPAPVPAKPTVCAGLSALVAAGRPWTHSSANAALQQYLIANGYANVITYGATSFWGGQTQAAVSLAQSACL